MIPCFSDPSNTFATGVTFLKSILFKEQIVKQKSCSTSFLIRRFFYRKETEKVIFIPLNYKCFLARKGDIVVLPDDSLRSIKSVIKVRFNNKSYTKLLYQIWRYILAYVMIRSLSRCVLYTVSKDDSISLRDRFPKSNIRYLPHPIQAAYNSGGMSKLNLNIKNIGFINLQDHYSVDALFFLSNNGLNEFKNKNIIFHGPASSYWFQQANKSNIDSNLFVEAFVQDFDAFFDCIDLVVMPLAAGAGVKNIFLNSIYKNKLVFGTREAFSGIPKYLVDSFIICSIYDVDQKLKNIELLERDFIELRNYILEHHTVVNFKLALLE